MSTLLVAEILTTTGTNWSSKYAASDGVYTIEMIGGGGAGADGANGTGGGGRGGGGAGGGGAYARLTVSTAANANMTLDSFTAGSGGAATGAAGTASSVTHAGTVYSANGGSGGITANGGGAGGAAGSGGSGTTGGAVTVAFRSTGGAGGGGAAGAVDIGGSGGGAGGAGGTTANGGAGGSAGPAGFGSAGNGGAGGADFGGTGGTAVGTSQNGGNGSVWNFSDRVFDQGGLSLSTFTGGAGGGGAGGSGGDRAAGTTGYGGGLYGAGGSGGGGGGRSGAGGAFAAGTNGIVVVTYIVLAPGPPAVGGTVYEVLTQGSGTWVPRLIPVNKTFTVEFIAAGSDGLNQTATAMPGGGGGEYRIASNVQITSYPVTYKIGTSGSRSGDRDTLFAGLVAKGPFDGGRTDGASSLGGTGGTGGIGYKGGDGGTPLGDGSGGGGGSAGLSTGPGNNAVNDFGGVGAAIWDLTNAYVNGVWTSFVGRSGDGGPSSSPGALYGGGGGGSEDLGASGGVGASGVLVISYTRDTQSEDLFVDPRYATGTTLLGQGVYGLPSSIVTTQVSSTSSRVDRVRRITYLVSNDVELNASYVSVPYAPNLADATLYTWEIWFRKANSFITGVFGFPIIGDNIVALITTNDGITSDLYSELYVDSNGAVGMREVDDRGASTVASPSLNAPVITTGQWVHLVKVGTATEQQLYVNGVLQSALTVSRIALSMPSRGMVVLGGSPALDHYQTCQIGGVRMFTHVAWDAATVSSAYTNPVWSPLENGFRFSDIRTKFAPAATGPLRLSQFYENGAFVNTSAVQPFDIPTAGRLSLKNFVGAIRLYINDLLSSASLSSLQEVYSIRLIVNQYTGPVLKIRRSIDSVLEDFYGNRSGDSLKTLNGEDYTTWIGESTGFVHTWFDQSGNTRNATQTTTTAQPILSWSTREIQFDGSSQFLNLPSQAFLNNTSYTLAIVTKRTSSKNTNYVLGGLAINQNTNLHYGWINGSLAIWNYAHYANDQEFAVRAVLPSTPQIIIGHYALNSNRSLFINKSETARTFGEGNTAPLSNIGTQYIGKYYTNTFYAGTISEALIFTSVLPANDRKIINDDTFAMYNITIPPMKFVVFAKASAHTGYWGGITIDADASKNVYISFIRNNPSTASKADGTEAITRNLGSASYAHLSFPKYSSVGVPLWFAYVAASGWNNRNMINRVLSNGDVLVIASHATTNTVAYTGAGTSAKTLSHTGGLQWDIYGVRYDTNGNFIAGDKVSDSEYIRNVEKTPDAGFLLGYVSSGGTVYNMTNGTAVQTITNTNNRVNYVIVKYNSANTVSWVTKIGSPSGDISYFDTGNNGNLLVADQSTGDILTFGHISVDVDFFSASAATKTLTNPGQYFARYNSSGNNLVAQKLFTSNATDAYIRNIVVAKDSSFFIQIAFNQSIIPMVLAEGSTNSGTAIHPITNGVRSLCVIKYSSSGDILWSAVMGSTDSDLVGSGLVASPDGGVFVRGAWNNATGTSNQVRILDSNGFIQYTLTRTGVQAIFIAKYDTDGVVKDAIKFDARDSTSSIGNPQDVISYYYQMSAYGDGIVSVGSFPASGVDVYETNAASPTSTLNDGVGGTFWVAFE